LKSAYPKAYNDIEYHKNKQGYVHNPTDIRRTGDPGCGKAVD